MNNKWTPISEGMPDTNDFVLITHLSYDDGFGWLKFVNMADFGRDDDGWHWYSYAIDGKVEEFTNVIAWMPLPEPYGTEATE